MKNESVLKHAAFVGLFVVVLYVACLLWRYTITDPEVMRFHLLSLKTAFPGFKGYDTSSMFLGGVISFLYGLVFSLIFNRLHGKCLCGK